MVMGVAQNVRQNSDLFVMIVDGASFIAIQGNQQII
jgi:hypothetical protein